jgi:hypothetical protein
MVKYIPNGNVKIVVGGKTYQNNGEEIAVLPENISKDELDYLLSKKFIVRQKEIDGKPNHSNKDDKPKKPPKDDQPLLDKPGEKPEDK